MKKLLDNKREIQEKIHAARTPEERTGLLMKMARLYFSNNFGQETLGLLGLVQKENPDAEKNPDFIALRGAANAMAGYYKEALQDLSLPSLQRYPEAQLWVGFAAAASNNGAWPIRPSRKATGCCCNTRRTSPFPHDLHG